MTLNDDEVASFNAYQAAGLMHPFTCGNDHKGIRELYATPDGLKCHECDYVQDWAHNWMLNWDWKQLSYVKI